MNSVIDEDAKRHLCEVLTAAGCTLPKSGSATESRATRKWNGALKPLPELVVSCATAVQVSKALGAAREAGIAVTVHNGGQDWTGRSLRDGSLVLDISDMTEIFIDGPGRVAIIGGGVTAGQLNRAAGAEGLAAVIGNDGAVSMAGLMLGGGYGPLMTRFGLACDNLLSAEVVLPHGKILTCDTNNHPDLFWALRGGGGNFGILTSARVRLHVADPLLSGTIIFAWPDAKVALRRFAELMLRAPAELFGAAILSLGPGGSPVLVISLNWASDLDVGDVFWAEMKAAGSPVVAETKPLPATDLLSLTDGKLAQGNAYEVATRWFGEMTGDVVDDIIAAYERRTSSFASIVIHHCHGLATSIPTATTAFAMREPHFTALIYGAWKPDEVDAEHRHWVRQTDATLAASSLPGGYANLLSDQATDQIAQAFGDNASRLAQVKKAFDPGGALRAIPLPSFG